MIRKTPCESAMTKPNGKRPCGANCELGSILYPFFASIPKIRNFLQGNVFVTPRGGHRDARARDEVRDGHDGDRPGDQEQHHAQGKHRDRHRVLRLRGQLHPLPERHLPARVLRAQEQVRARHARHHRRATQGVPGEHPAADQRLDGPEDTAEARAGGHRRGIPRSARTMGL